MLWAMKNVYSQRQINLKEKKTSIMKENECALKNGYITDTGLCALIL